VRRRKKGSGGRNIALEVRYSNVSSELAQSASGPWVAAAEEAWIHIQKSEVFKARDVLRIETPLASRSPLACADIETWLCAQNYSGRGECAVNHATLATESSLRSFSRTG
jgi:hypothetical protein